MNNQSHKNNKTLYCNNRSVEKLLIEASHIINQDIQLESLLKNILSILTSYLEAQVSAIFLIDSSTGRTELHSYSAEGDLIKSEFSPADRKSVASLVIEKKEPILLNEKNCSEELKDYINEKLNICCVNVMASPIIRRDKLLGVIEVFNKMNARDFDEDDLEIMTALGDQIALAVVNARLYQKARRKTEEAQSLYEVGKLLSGALKLEELLKLIVDQVSHLVKFDVATIFTVAPEDGSIIDIVSKGITPEDRLKLPLKIGQGICGYVAKTGKSVFLNDVTADKQYLSCRSQTKSEIAVPLISRNKVIGVFNVESDLLDAYNQDDLELLETFGSQAAVSIERATLYHQSMEQKSLEEKLSIARKIQQTFLPKKDPVIDNFNIAGVNISSEAVGGDYYDFIDIVENQIGIAIGDVSGKGLGASLIMAAFRASLKAEIRNNYAIRTIFAKVNSLLYESIERENYVTAVYGVLDAKNHVFTFSNAGHNPPLIFKTDGKIIELSEGGLALGMFADSIYEERPVYINKGDILLFYTDGVTEAQDSQDREFGLTRLKKLIEEFRTSSAKEITQKVIDSVQKFKAPASQLDDLTMILVKCL